MGPGATELENLNEEGGELTFCYVGITRDTVCFTLPIYVKKQLFVGEWKTSKIMSLVSNKNGRVKKLIK